MLALFTERSRTTACQSTWDSYVMDHPVNNIGPWRGIDSPRVKPEDLKGQHVKLKRFGVMAGAAITATLALAACGTDNNTTPPPAGGSGAPTTAAISCKTGSLTSQGSTAQLNAMNEWIKDYKAACSGANIDYQGTGSGAGVTAFESGTADFAGSDSALSGADVQKAGTRCGTGNNAIDLPMVIGPIAVVTNVSGASNLQFSAPTLAKIFSGKITKWNDAAIMADNPGVTLPATPILTVHRSDSSGTSDNFTKYLSTVAASDWTYGHNKVWPAPGGTAQKGSDGISASIKANDGSIGYVEWSFAQLNNLNMAKIKNGSGSYQDLTAQSAAATIGGAKITGTGNDLTMSVDYNTTASGAYPIVLVTYEIVCEKCTPADKLALLKSFLTYTATGGQSVIGQLGYAALPSEVASKVQSSISAMS
jgi:phosphate transport system substrate-binding protein